jgi:hypothetical protein
MMPKLYNMLIFLCDEVLEKINPTYRPELRVQWTLCWTNTNIN